MANTTFLDQLAHMLLEAHNGKFTQTIVVLPNKRARIFLLEALKRQSGHTIFAPQIVSIEDLIQDIAGIRAIDPIELLFEFYEAYLSVTPQGPQPFDLFANWAKTLLQDFNEIDRYLLEPDKILKYLEEIKEIEHWSVDPEKRTELIASYLEFWKLLPVYYHTFYDHLSQKGIGYQGLIYREAVNNLNHYSHSLNEKQLIFAGFNALNAAEEQIIQHLIASGQGQVFWDADQALLNDPYHDAGLFLRRFKSGWKHYKSHPFQWEFDDFAKEKNIRVIGTPKSIGQAKIAGSIIEKLLSENDAATDKIAMVLGEESLLIPVLHALPQSVDALNITMGYPAKNNPAQILIAKLFRMHTNALSRNAASYVFYYKDIIDVLTNPLIEPYAGAKMLTGHINRYNYTFITHKKLTELHPEGNALFGLLFHKWEQGPVAVLESLSQVLQIIKSKLRGENDQDKIAQTFVYAVFKTINKLTSYCSRYNHVQSTESLYSIYKQVIDLAEVSFEGEPLDGLQIMGVLESRVLDFDTVIVTSMNEGKFPAGKSQNSFIPYDVKKEYGLPTFKEKDAIYTYHFYHLLQRAQNIYLLYNTESEGLDAGEKSRFITQLEVEKQQAHHLTHTIYNAALPEEIYKPLVIPKSDKAMERLEEIAEKGFSPSALTSYIRNPIDFYFQKLLRINEVEEVEENIALNTLGTIIHGTLEALYLPYIGKILTQSDIEDCQKRLDEEVLNQFKLVYREGEIRKGRNLLAFEVAKRNVSNFLKLELSDIKAGDAIQILALEMELRDRFLLHKDLPYPVRIGGAVDRIEFRSKEGQPGRIRIVDYKTGKVEKNNLILKTWDGLTDELKNDKIIQLLSYAFMYESHAQGREVEVGIISFKNLKTGFMPFVFHDTVAKTQTAVITDEIMAQYTDQIAILLKEILDPQIPFTEKII